jgi:XTP/dITP diphosphohydrolase
MQLMNFELTFVTSNDHKYNEARTLFESSSIDLKRYSCELMEPNFETLEEIAEFKCKQAFEEIGKPVVVDDSGIFFEAYSNFPGVNSARVFKGIGFEGVLALLKGKSRKAFFRSVCCYTCDGVNFEFFSGKLDGEITKEVSLDVPYEERLPYKRIFTPQGYDVPIGALSLKEITTFDHRSHAFRQLADFLSAS